MCIAKYVPMRNEDNLQQPDNYHASGDVGARVSKQVGLVCIRSYLSLCNPLLLIIFSPIPDAAEGVDIMITRNICTTRLSC